MVYQNVVYRTVKRRLFPYIVGLMLVMLAAMNGIPGGAGIVPAGPVDLKAAAMGAGLNGLPAAVAAESVQIPADAIRFRVLANSNTVADQWVKKRVKEAILPEIQAWLEGAEDAQEVRRRIQDRLDDIQALADDVLREHGFFYRSQVTFGHVAFPAASVLNQRFEAGNYEALRITLGDGRGDNYWCVMFPPLCFGSPADPWGVAKAEGSASGGSSGGGALGETNSQPEADAQSNAPSQTSPSWAVEFRIFIWDWIRGWLA